MRYLPVLLKDGYKVGHKFQYPADTTHVYSNFTPRNTRRGAYDQGDGIIFFGLQAFVQKYLQDDFDEGFFGLDKDDVLRRYKRRIDNYLGPDSITYDHIAALHDLQYLPLRIKAVPEGTLVPYGVPALTVVNTVPEFYWLTNMLETLMSAALWKGSTSATTAFHYRQKFEDWARKTGSPLEFVPFQGHDFSFRGMSGVDDAALSGAGHLLSFVGTDTIPAIDFLEAYYFADSDKELIGCSVPATEHSVMCMGTCDGEFATFKRLVSETYPKGIVSIVSDTWDLWTVLTKFLPDLKGQILARDGKVVIRPDSGDPVKIICGDPEAHFSDQRAGAVELLWDAFGGTVNEAGYKELDPHVGLIYGDSISPERQTQILAGLAAKGFAANSVVLGIGSYTYQYVTRDTDGWAMKATAGRTKSQGLINIFKDPITDDGGKRSATGLLCVERDANGKLVLEQAVSEERERAGVLETVFIDGALVRMETLAEIRARVESLL